MPSTELTKGVHKKILTSSFIDQLLSLLEKFSDEAFWTNLFGERILNLLKKYFGSDVMFLGLIVYIAPIVGYRINNLFYYLISEVKTRMYVTIHLSKNEMGYTPVQEFIASQTTQIRNLREVEAKCIEDESDEIDLQGPSSPPKVHLYPMEETEQQFTYKGYTLWATKKKNGSAEKHNHNYYSNDIKELFGMMNTNPTIQITMRGQNMNMLKGFIQEWINMHHEKENGKLTIYKCSPTRYDGFDWQSVGTKELRALSSVILKDGQKEKILHDIQTFRRRDRWYASRGIPYRRGYLLFGPPGTGKTSLVQSIASKVNMNVAIISLSGNMDDENFNVMLQEVPRNSILVMEDIDHCIIKDPSSSKTEGTSKITMSGLLNALDGVVAQEGTMIFMTCNDVNKIQPALLRPGRIDMKMELGYADKSQISQMFWRFIGPDEEELAKMRKNSIVSDHPLEINEQQADFEASRKELEELERKFTDAIPDLTVTPAELQNFFIMNTMNQEENDMDYSFVLDGIPEFLESVQRDREQALMHKNQSNNISNENNNTTATTATSTQEEEKA